MLLPIINKIFRTKGIRSIFRFFYYQYLRKKVNNDLRRMEDKIKMPKEKNESTQIYYFRTDIWAKTNSASGAVAHTKGVVEALAKKYSLTLVSPAKFNYIECKVNYQVVSVDNMLSSGINELAELEYNQYLKTLLPKIKEDNPKFIYQRYGLDNYIGAYISRLLNIPFVLEYNGSEIWMSKNWGKRFHFEEMVEKIEMADFLYADLIVANAEPMKEELIERGIDEKKILIIPNGVDPSRFSPDVDGKSIREKYNLNDENILITFVGTFGPWHGAEVLAETVKYTCQSNDRVRYMFVGNGTNFQLVSDIVQDSGFSDRVILTGIIPQLDTPPYLAASDILVTPQIPNPDGTPFFGSPTKLFEYMAMGKAIVASNLDQMSFLLSNNETALLTEPSNVTDLTNAILRLAKDSELRNKLGANARNEILEKYTWDKHIDIILNELDNIL